MYFLPHDTLKAQLIGQEEDIDSMGMYQILSLESKTISRFNTSH